MNPPAHGITGVKKRKYTWLVTEHLEIGCGITADMNKSAEKFLVIGKIILEY